MKKLFLLSLAMVGSVSMVAQQKVVGDKPVNSALEAVQAIDNVVLSQPAKAAVEVSSADLKASAVSRPGAYYERPRGTLYAGMSLNGYTLTKHQLFVQPFVDYTWSFNPLEGVTYDWHAHTGYDSDGKIVYTDSKETSINANYTNSMYYAPELNGTNEAGDSTYVVADFLRPDAADITSESAGQFGLTNLKPGYTRLGILGNTITNSADANKLIAEKFKMTEDQGYTDVKIVGITELFYAQARPYLLKDLWCFAYDYNGNIQDQPGVPGPGENIKVNLTIQKVTTDEDGNLTAFGDVICTAENDQSYIKKGNYGQFIYFPDLVYEDPETGRTSDLIIDSDILVTLSAADENTRLCQYLFTSTDNADINDTAHRWDNCTNMITVSYNKDGQSYTGVRNMGGAYYMDDARTQVGFFKAYNINLGAENYFMYSADTEFTTDGKADASKKFDVYTNDEFPSKLWDVATEDGDDVPDWISFNAVDWIYEDQSYAGHTELTISTTALPAGVEGRSVVLEFNNSTSCGSLKIKVSQGSNSGVEVVEASDVKVATVGGNFELTYPASATSVNIYNVAGALVKTVALDASGNAVVDAQDLANGMYLIQFNNNVTVKAVK